MTAYAATKAGVSAITRGAALDHIGDGVRINAISPGPIDTTMSLRPGETPADRATRLGDTNPLGRVGTLDEVAAAVLWLCSPESSFTVGHDLVRTLSGLLLGPGWIGGQPAVLDGGANA